MTTLFQETNDTPEFDQNKDYLAELVGDGKKFKDTAALAKGKAESDAYIALMTKKMDELRADYLKARDENTATAKLQDLIDRLENRNEDINSNTSNADEDKSGLKLEDIESLFSTKLTEYERTKKETENFNKVQAKLKELHGDNYSKFLSQQMETLGLSKEDIDQMARQKPQVLIKSLGLDQPKSTGFTPPPRSDHRNDNFLPSSGQKRTWSYYQELKKSNPTLYHDPKINLQMQKDAMELGDAFMDGDFNN